MNRGDVPRVNLTGWKLSGPSEFPIVRRARSRLSSENVREGKIYKKDQLSPEEYPIQLGHTREKRNDRG